MLATAQIIERLTLKAAFGAQFHDAATGAIVTDGLNVIVRRAADVEKRRENRAFPNRSGVYVLHSLNNFDSENPAQTPCIVEVADAERRFQPFQFEVELPQDGVFQWEITSPPNNSRISSVPLYSAPTRRTASGMSRVSAELWDAENECPAAFAILEAFFGNRLIARGLADAKGNIVLMFPVLAPKRQTIASPPNASSRIPLHEQSWELKIAVKYEPETLAQSPPQNDISNNLPDLRRALAPRAGKIWKTAARDAQLKNVDLQHGTELILRSEAVASPPNLAGKLLVSAAN